jgi:hypothetical protein
MSLVLAFSIQKKLIIVLPGPVPGPCDSANNKAGKGREGKGRKEEREGKRKGKGGPPERKGAGLRCGWMDGWMDREENKRSNGGREDLGKDNIRRERFAWTTVFVVCFIDRTW